MKHYKSYAASIVAAFACLLILHTGAAAKLVPVEQPAPASANSATPPPAPSKSATPSAIPAPPPDDDRLPFMLGPEQNAHIEQPSAVGLLARTIGALLLIIGLLVGGSWALRRIKGSPFAASRDDAGLVVLKTISIGDRRTLTVVRFGERTLLLGSTQQAVTLLASDDEEDLSSWTPAEPPFRSVADVLATSLDNAPTPEISFASEMERNGELREDVKGGRLEQENRSAKWR
jgi:flagellar biogenesis protein FliO